MSIIVHGACLAVFAVGFSMFPEVHPSRHTRWTRIHQLTLKHRFDKHGSLSDLSLDGKVLLVGCDKDNSVLLIVGRHYDWDGWVCSLG